VRAKAGSVSWLAGARTPECGFLSATMYTVCPKCALTLVVTAGDLRLGQGYVRCGRCSNVFNALVGLSEERQAALKGESPASSAPTDASDPAASISELPRELSEGPDPEEVPDTALEFDPESADLTEVFVEARPGPHDVTSGTFETIVLESGDLPRVAANDGEAEAQAANESIVQDGELATREVASGGASFDRSRIETPRLRETSAGPNEDSSAPDAVAAGLASGDSAPSTRRAFTWSAGIVLAVLLLAAQLLHHHRDELAVDARYREPLTALYAALGIPLAPRWDLAEYDVRQLGASADAGSKGVLTVRASVQNSGDNPQPLPLLRVTVQDRFGNRIAARDVGPASYAGSAAAISDFLEVGERIDAEIQLADPGPDAVGFELDACLPYEGGRIACANEQRARSR
jgi:predicted Zn finger-like uncharacterized protein